MWRVLASVPDDGWPGRRKIEIFAPHQTDALGLTCMTERPDIMRSGVMK